MATDSATIYREILAQARTATSSSLASSHVTISPAVFADGILTPHVQLILPGEAVFEHERSGVGLAREEFEVAVIQKIMRDELQKHTTAISNATSSVTALVTTVRGDGDAMGASGLHNFVCGNAEGPITLLGWGRMRQHEEDPDILIHVDRYRLEYELASYQ